jgi:hypothetical protein
VTNCQPVRVPRYRTVISSECACAAAMFINLELGPNQSGCPTPSMVPAAPGIVDETCQLGAQAAYEVNATSAHDISLSVKFAAKYRLRLRIKNVCRTAFFRCPSIDRVRCRPGTIILAVRWRLARSQSGRTT